MCRRQKQTSIRKFSSKEMLDKVSPSQAALLVVGAGLSGRLVYQSLIDAENQKYRIIRRDASRATILLDTSKMKTTSASKLTLEGLDKESETLHQVNAADFAKFCAKQRTILKEAQEKSKQLAMQNLRSELRDAFSDASGRVSSFSNWYFAYRTNWKLLAAAFASAAKHAVTFRTEQTLSEKVSEDLQQLVCRKYEALVLRPALTDPKIHLAFMRSVRLAHKDYLQSLEELEKGVATFVSKQTTVYSSPPRSDDVIVNMDWRTQLQKVDHLPISYEKSPQFSVALLGSGAVFGKIGGGAAAKAMLGKIVSPFVTKAVGATLGGGTAAVGAASGAMTAGPFGAAIGAAIGLGVDVAVNAGVALMQRSAFEKDVEEGLFATATEWEENIFLPELEKIQDLWFDQALSVLDARSDHEKGED